MDKEWTSDSAGCDRRPSFVVATPWDTLDMGKGQRSSVQLQLISGSGRGTVARRSSKGYRLDARTRRIGREGVAQAKAILSQATPPEPPGHRRAS